MFNRRSHRAFKALVKRGKYHDSVDGWPASDYNVGADGKRFEWSQVMIPWLVAVMRTACKQASYVPKCQFRFKIKLSIMLRC